jgi:hypothetical protein
MNHSNLHDPVADTSFRNSTSPSRENIRQGIKGFLAAQSCQQARVQICSRCGRKMEFTEATFWMDGEDERFTIRVPVCRCTVEQGPRRNDLGPCEA